MCGIFPITFRFWVFTAAELAVLNKETNMKKNIIIAILSMAVVLTLGALISLKRAYSLREYAIAHDCTWQWQGTMYGDDRDYVCK